MPYTERYTSYRIPLDSPITPPFNESDIHSSYDYLVEYKPVTYSEVITTPAGTFCTSKYEMTKSMKFRSEKEFREWWTATIWYSPIYGEVKRITTFPRTPFLRKLFYGDSTVEAEMTFFKGFDPQ